MVSNGYLELLIFANEIKVFQMCSTKEKRKCFLQMKKYSIPEEPFQYPSRYYS
jgi:hypothetical protein